MRAVWIEAEFLVYSKLRAGVHPEQLEKHLRKDLVKAAGTSHYRFFYVHAALLMLRTLCKTDMLANLPTYQEYQGLITSREMRAGFAWAMKERFMDFDLFRETALDDSIVYNLSEYT